ncbi:MAG: glycerate kinase [Thermoplasmata archaeon]
MPTFVIANASDLTSRPSSPQLRALRRDALDVLDIALRAVDAGKLLEAHLRRRGDILEADGLEWDLGQVDRLRLLAVGKASIPMAQAALRTFEPSEGLVITNTDQGLEIPNVSVLQATHPVPSASSLRAGEEALALAKRSGPHDLLLVLLSGGGSALLEHSDLPRKATEETGRLLLRSGMDIVSMNVVRKHLSLVKGGWLGKTAAQGGGEVATLALSDVIGDDPSAIASGPTVADPSTFGDARQALQDAGIWAQVPAEVREQLRAGIGGEVPETPKPGDPDLRRSSLRIVGSIADACRAAVKEGVRLGYAVHTYGTQLEGESRAVGQDLLSVAISVQERGIPVESPGLIVAGGETTFRVRGEGSGGRNLELVLASVRGLQGRPIVFLSCDTDGRDGETDVAGAIADGESLSRATSKGWEPEAFQAESDSYGFFTRLEDTIRTAATQTNVMDLQLVVVGPPPEQGGAS